MKTKILTLLLTLLAIESCHCHGEHLIRYELSQMSRVNHPMTCQMHETLPHSYQCCTNIAYDMEQVPICVELLYDGKYNKVYQTLVFSNVQLFSHLLVEGENCAVIHLIPYRLAKLCMYVFKAEMILHPPNLKYTSCFHLSIWWKDEYYSIPNTHNCMSYDKDKLPEQPSTRSNLLLKKVYVRPDDLVIGGMPTATSDELKNEIDGIVDDYSSLHRSTLTGRK